jgi:hypothetical protein
MYFNSNDEEKYVGKTWLIRGYADSKIMKMVKECMSKCISLDVGYAEILL